MITLSRRDLLKGGGALVVGFIASPAVEIALGQTRGVIAGKPALMPDELDSWIAVQRDGSVIVYFGKMDMGQGVDVAIAQIVADELDVAVDRVKVVMGDTALTCNQGGASGSTGVPRGGVTLRFAAAEARRLLLERAAEKLGAPVDTLTVRDGIVFVGGDEQKRIAYAEFIGGGHFHHKLEWNNQYGNTLLSKGKATPKKPSEYRVAGNRSRRASSPTRSMVGCSTSPT